MSGHSKWSKIKRKKGKEDQRRGVVFTKLIKEITTAARFGGGDPDSNSRLRLAILKAKESNMPQSNIERAIKKGTGELEGVSYEDGVYEGYGPGGVAFLVEILTDNKNRTISDVRKIFSKNGGSLGEAGCVSWMFEKRGTFSFNREKVDSDRLYEVAMDADVEDIKEDGEDLSIITSCEDFESIKQIFYKEGLGYYQSDITMIPKNITRIEEKDASQLLKLIETLEDNEDIQNVYSNFDMPQDLIEKIVG